MRVYGFNHQTTLILMQMGKDPYGTGYCSQKMVPLCVCAHTGNNDYYKFI